MPEQCSDCQYYEALRGICRFKAPKPLVDKSTGSAYASWPKVEETDVCGNFLAATVITGDCSGCWFFDEGLCAYHAPEIRVGRATGSAFSDWPLVANDDWCGRWSAVDVDPESVPWEKVTGKPAEFTPEDHVHDWTDITTGVPATFPPSSHTHPWTEVTSKPSTFPPSAHTHDYTTDLYNIPLTFPPEAHTHSWSEITSKPATFPPEAHNHDWSEITTGVPATFPPSSHTHPLTQLTGPTGPSAVIGTAVDTVGSVNVPGGAGAYVLHAAADGIGGVTFSWHDETTLEPVIAWGDVTGKPSTFTPSSHTHSITSDITAGNYKLFASNGSGAITEIDKPGSDDEWVLISTVSSGVPSYSWVTKASLDTVATQYYYHSFYADGPELAAAAPDDNYAFPAFGDVGHWTSAGNYADPALMTGTTDDMGVKGSFVISPAPFSGKVVKITATNVSDTAVSDSVTVSVVKTTSTAFTDGSSNTVLGSLTATTISQLNSASSTPSSGNTFSEGDLLFIYLDVDEADTTPWRINIKYEITG